MLFYLIRHGEKFFYKKDVSLTEHGRLEAKLTGMFLRKNNIEEMFSSPALRAKETSDIISNILNLRYVIDRRLVERFDWYGSPFKTYREFEFFWLKSSTKRDLKPDFGDSSIGAGERMEQFLIEKTEQCFGKNILVVSHGGIIADYLRNNFKEKLIKISGLKDLVKIYDYISFCSITTLSFENNKFDLVDFANTKHLKSLVKSF